MSIFDRLDDRKRAILQHAREIAASRGLSPFLVGGPVRDLRLGRNSDDLDFTIETGAHEFAIALARRLNGTVSGPTRFLTLKVSTPEGDIIDIAAARRERYASPGALPEVESADLDTDLWRRDFSINAMAIGVLDERVVDPSGGNNDLTAGVIRVLHERSFMDDPTRIARAIRFSNRFSFRIEDGTSMWIREALRAGATETISIDRLWRELVLMTRESRPAPPLQLASSMGVFEPLTGPIDEQALQSSLSRAVAATRLDPEVDSEVIFAAAVLEAARDRDSVVERLPIPRDRANLILVLAQRDDLAVELREMRERRKRLRRIAGERIERIAYLEAGESDLTGLTRDLRAFRAIEVGVRGDDLDVVPGPHVGSALYATREALFFGDIAPDDAVSFAKACVLKYLSERK